MVTSEYRDLRLSRSERLALIEYLSIAIATLLEHAKDAELTRRPIAQMLRDSAGLADTMRGRLRKL